MTVRITRAKPEQAGSGGDGGDEQTSVMRAQQRWAEGLAVAIFTQLVQLDWPELPQMQRCHVLHGAADRRSLSASKFLASWEIFPKRAYMYFIGTLIPERVSGRGAPKYPTLWLPNPLLDP